MNVEYTVKELVYGHEKAFIPDKAAGINAVVQYHLTGEESGDYIIKIGNERCTVSEGTAKDAVLVLTSDGGYWRDILLGKEDAMKGFMSGRLQLIGDIKLAIKLIGYFKIDS